MVKNLKGIIYIFLIIIVYGLTSTTNKVFIMVPIDISSPQDLIRLQF